MERRKGVRNECLDKACQQLAVPVVVNGAIVIDATIAIATGPLGGTPGNVIAMTVTNSGGSGGVNPANFVGAQAITPPHLPAGTYCAIVVDGKVYVARMHTTCWELADKSVNIQFYGSAQIDAAGTVGRLFQ